MGKEKDFTFLDPSAAQVRHSRVQFMLTAEEYAVLEAAAILQGTKPGELAGAIFRRHVMVGLAEEVNRLRGLVETDAQDTVDGNRTEASVTLPTMPE